MIARRVGSTVLFVIATVLAADALGQQSAAGTAVLSGRVVRSDIAARPPVGRVVVRLDAGDNRGPRQTMTDDEGRFEFAQLPTGRFLLTASKTGWVTTYYGSTRPGRPPGVRIAVTEGSKVVIEVPIVMGSVIAGRIVDESGQPMAREFPILLEQRLVGDRQMLARMRMPFGVGFFERGANDLGEFRLFGLPPGTYHLLVTPTITSGARLTTPDEVRWALQPPGAAGVPPPQGSVAGYAPFFFPGTTDPLASQAIVVGPGEVREGLVFRVGFVNVARVEGVIRRDDGGAASGARIELVARVPQVNLEGSTRTSTADASGRFVFQNVPPGDYRLMARSAPAPRLPDGTSPPGPLQCAETGLVVSGQDVQNLGLTLEPAPVMTGRVGFTGTTFAPPSDLTTIRLQFVETDAIASQLAGGSGTRSTFTAVVDAGGSFRVEGLPPGRYGVSASWPGIRRADGEGWWLTDISIGGRSIGDAPIDVRLRENVADVTIGFRDRIGMIEGRLTDPAGQPAAEYFVLAFPAERSLWTTTSRRAVPAVRPGTDGRFRLAGLLAGDYFVAVVTAIEPDEVMDPAFLSAILPGAIRLAVKDGETVRQDLKIGR